MHNGEKLLFYSVYATIGKLSCALADLLDLKISEIPLSLSLCRVTFSVVVNH